MNIKIIIIILFLLISKISLAGTMTATSGNMDYAMTRSSVPDVLDGLVLHVPLRQSGMSYAQDVSPYKVQGTITGATWATGTARGLYFDGVDDNGNIGDPADGHLDFGTGSFSFGCNVCPQKIDGTSDIFLAKATTSNYTGGYSFWITAAGKYKGEIDTTAITSSSFNSNTLAGTSTWICLYMVVDQSTYPNTKGKYYENGIQVGTTSNFLGTGTTNNANNLTLGALSSPSNYTKCYLDDVRIYNRALTGNEVERIYQATKH